MSGKESKYDQYYDEIVELLELNTKRQASIILAERYGLNQSGTYFYIKHMDAEAGDAVDCGEYSTDIDVAQINYTYNGNCISGIEFDVSVDYNSIDCGNCCP